MLAATRGAVGVVVHRPCGTSAHSLRAGSRRRRFGSDRTPINEAVRYSARPWMFFVPPHDNPLVGDGLGPGSFNACTMRRSTSRRFTWATPFGSGTTRFFASGDSVLFRASPVRARPVVAGAVVGLVIAIGPYIPLEGDYWRDGRPLKKPLTCRPSPGSCSTLRPCSASSPGLRPYQRIPVVLAAIGFARFESWARLLWPCVGLATLAIGLIGLEYSNSPPHVWFSAKQPPWVEAVVEFQRARHRRYPFARRSHPVRSTTCSGRPSTAAER